MANDERLGASFSIDITSLKTGLNQANKLIRESESEFKAAAAGMDNWSKSEDGLNAKIKSLTDITEIQQKKVDALKEEYQGLVEDGLDPTSQQAVELRTKINNEQAALNKNKKELENQTKALEELQDSSEDAGNSIEETGKQARESGEGFTIAKGAIANLISEGLTALVGACKNAISSMMNLSEETQEYREDIGKLKTAWESAGKTTEQATKIYKEFYSVLGEEDRSVEAVNHIAKLVETEEDMQKWTDICTGVWGTFGDSLPIEGLTEAANETAKVGDLTGVLADALNWAGVNEDDFQASLDECSDEQERAALITETLNGLYSEAADNYRENNKSVIEARKSTSEYTDTLAEMGEALEPSKTAITELKTEFIKGLTPAIKKNVIPAINSLFKDLKKDKTIEKFTQGISNLANKVLPVASKALKFLAENFETIVKVAGTAVTVFATFNAVLKVSTAIKAVQTAMAGLSAATSVATAAQTGLNAAMAANPIGAVITAVALLTVGLVSLISAQKDAEESTDVLSESQREAVTASSEAAEAYRETKAAADELASAQMANVEYVANNLLPQLQGLVGANGEVQASDQARVDFILGQLNEALGTEYSSIQDVIDQNGNLKQSILDVIETKKAQILLDAYLETYTEATQKVTEAEQARATQAQAVAAAQGEVTAATEAEKKAQEELEAAIESGDMTAYMSIWKHLTELKESTKQKKASLEEQVAAYNQAEADVQGYYDTIDSYESASTAALEGNTAKAVDLLSKYGTGFKTASSTAKEGAEEQKKILEDQVVTTETNLKIMEADYSKYSKSMTDEEKTQAEERIKSARKQAEDAKEEFKKVGGDIVWGMAEGADEEGWILNETMADLINDAVSAARLAADSHSPSRLFKKKVGVTIGQGVAVGIEDSTKDVLNSVKAQIGAIENAYNLDGVAGTVERNINLKASGNNTAEKSASNGVTVYQTNNYSQTHSRYELYKTKQETAAAVRLALGV